MSVRFWWCHTDGCPAYGRPLTQDEFKPDCPYCGEGLRFAAPHETPPIPEEVAK